MFILYSLQCGASHLFSSVSGGTRVTQSSGHLAVLGEVEGGDLLGLLDLLLVALHLVLQLVHQLLHPLVVLGVMNVSQQKDDPTKNKEQAKTFIQEKID